MSQNDHGGQLDALTDTESAPSKPVFGVGEQGAVPLAAVFKTRRRKKKKQAEAPEATPPPLDAIDVEDLVLELEDLGGELEESLSDGPDATVDMVAAPSEQQTENSAIDTQPMAAFDINEVDLSPMSVDEIDLGMLGGDDISAGDPADFAEQTPSTPPPALETTAEAPALQMQGPSLGDVIPPNADPTWARDAILSLATEYAEQNRTANRGAWFAEMFRSEYLLASPRRRPEHIEREVEYVERCLNVAAGGRIFDLCSGFGKHSVPMARRGYEVVGLDLSIDMLQHALARAQAESLSIKFVHGDMRDLNFDEVFDGAYCMDTSFGYFSEVENLNVLRGLFNGLKPGGRFVLDVINRDYALQEVPNRNWWEGDGCLVQEDIEFNHRTSRLQIKRYLVFADGNERIYDVNLRLYSCHELIRMMELVGFEVVEICGGLDTVGVFFGASSRRILMTARRPA